MSRACGPAKSLSETVPRRKSVQVPRAERDHNTVSGVTDDAFDSRPLDSLVNFGLIVLFWDNLLRRKTAVTIAHTVEPRELVVRIAQLDYCVSRRPHFSFEICNRGIMQA